MALLPSPPLAAFLIAAPLLYYYSNSAWSTAILYAHALVLSMWLASIQELALIFQKLLGISSKAPAINTKDMYGLQHVIYNIQVAPKSFWFNMGYWDSENSTFAQACQALVRKVMDQLGGHPEHLLDVGFGCGDSCFMLAEEYHCKVTGITIEQSQYELAQTRLHHQYCHLKNSVRLLQGSATELSLLQGSATELSSNTLSNNASARFDAIIAIDCAYHFNTRWSFLTEAKQLLSPNGHIALFDIAVQPHALLHPWKRKLFEKICSLGNIPIQNIVNYQEYEAKLRAIGYQDVHITRIDVDQVYGGLARFMRRQAQAFSDNGLDLNFGNHNRLIVVAYFLQLLCWGQWIEPIIVTARGGPPQ